MKYVIIGNSAAGINAAEAIRGVDSEGEIVVISDEDLHAYSRCLTSYFVEGSVSEEEMDFRPKDFYEKHKITSMLGVRVEQVLSDEKQLRLSDGGSVGYDKLLIATGGTPKKQGIPGEDKQGVHTLRTLPDAKGIVSLLKDTKVAAVLGGGLIGMKIAHAVHHNDVDVKVIVKSNRILSQMVDEDAAKLLRKVVEDNGIEVMTGLAATEVLGEKKVTGLKLDDGSTIESQLVIVGKGVNANMDLVKGTDIKCEYGIIVNDHVRTSVPDVYAAGDVAQTYDLARGETWTNAMWPCAAEQGRIAGLNMAGQDAVYHGSMGMNSIQLFGVPAISMGITRPRGEEYEILTSEGVDTYRKVVLKDNRVVGMIVVGKVENSGVLGVLMRKQVDVSEIKPLLLREDFDYAKIAPLVHKEVGAFKESEFRRTVESYSPEAVAK